MSNHKTNHVGIKLLENHAKLNLRNFIDRLYRKCGPKIQIAYSSFCILTRLVA